MTGTFYSEETLIETITTNIEILEALRDHAKKFPDFRLDIRVAFKTTEAHSQNLIKILEKSIKDTIVYSEVENAESCVNDDEISKYLH